MTQRTLTIQHPTFGSLVNENFSEEVQFKLFLQLIHSCLIMKEDMTTFNGKDLLIHIPYETLRGSVILGNTNVTSLAEYAVMKSKMEG
jgi:hypothetical protein